MLLFEKLTLQGARSVLQTAYAQNSAFSVQSFPLQPNSLRLMHKRISVIE